MSDDEAMENISSIISKMEQKLGPEYFQTGLVLKDLEELEL